LGGAANDHDVDGGFTTLLSPTLDLSGVSSPTISYWRWYFNQSASNPTVHHDVLTVEISNDNGAHWVNAETVGPSGTETNGGWFQHTINVAALVAPTATMRLHFIAGDLNFPSTVEALIDDVSISGTGCTTHPGDLNGDGLVDLSDVAILISHYGITGGATHDFGDLNGDGLIDLSDIAMVLSDYGH
ncbi:MAG: hypothetical protein HY269_09235, partial [Deltaproteobacteria bacterium]|nr:hypothetical protein [Deltaproteobacteria bacterium]